MRSDNDHYVTARSWGYQCRMLAIAEAAIAVSRGSWEIFNRVAHDQAVGARYLASNCEIRRREASAIAASRGVSHNFRLAIAHANLVKDFGHKSRLVRSAH